MKSNRKELAILRGKRTPETLEDWAKVFGEGDRQKAERYALAVATFIGNTPEGEWSDYLGTLSPNTRKAYAFAVAEFFEWIAAKHGRVVPPHRVTRKDSEDYVSWLANRDFSLAEEKLKDGDMENQLRLFETVKTLSRCTLSQIVDKMPERVFEEYFGTQVSRREAQDLNGEGIRASRLLVSRDVRSLVTMDILVASPTMEQLRRDYPQAGISQYVLNDVPLEDMFTYVVKVYPPVSRTTVALRIAALSTFWKILMQGENVSGGEAILQYDIWEGVKRRVNRGITPAKKAASRQQKVPTEVVLKMLENAPSNTLVKMRDRAILYLMVFSGLRTTELLKLRRGNTGSAAKMPYFDGSEPPALQVLRKGNKWMRIPYPPVALKPLIEFQRELDRHAVPTFAQYRDENSEDDYVPFGIGYYYRDLQLPDAPLFPSIAMWGNNVKTDYRKSMSRVNLYKLLQKMAEDAGVPAEQVKKVHPHALRHFSANAMAEGGKDLREIQHILGHSSITTTEGYLEDVEDEVKLSGQAEILDFLKAQGVEVEATYEKDKEKPKPTSIEPQVIDTYAVETTEGPEVIDAEFEDPDFEPISDIEIEVLNEVVTGDVPDHTLPVLPPADVSDVFVVDTAEGDVIVAGETKQLVGIAGGEQDEEFTQETLDEIVETITKEISPSSPMHVYESLEAGNPKEYERVVFNRGKKMDEYKEWLFKLFPKMPPRFGVGRESLLVWYVKVRGNVTNAGFFKKVHPPFPVWAPEQISPQGRLEKRRYIGAVEKLYSEFMYGNEELEIAPSPIRALGVIQWFGFFAYNSRKFSKAFGASLGPDRPDWVDFDQEIDISEKGNLRMHHHKWLIDWLQLNSHTFRASVDAMKRGVQRGKTADDPEDSFLRASFEGIDIFEKMPDWMIEDDPVHALYEEDPEEYKEFVKWLKNVTGQALTVSRRDDRASQSDQAKDTVKRQAEDMRGALLLAYESRNEMESAKYKEMGGSSIADARENFRTGLITYLNAAAGQTGVSVADYQKLMSISDSKAFSRVFGEICEKAGVFDPYEEQFTDIRNTKDRIEAVIKATFPEDVEMADANIFAESALFNPSWFRIDEENHTIFIEPEAEADLWNTYGIRQSPTLLVRRAARAMYEARDSDIPKLWGVMMSYFSYLVPTGAEMESMIRPIPIQWEDEKPTSRFNREAREEWFTSFKNDVLRLAEGKPITRDSKEKETGTKKYGDVMQYRSVSEDAFEFLASQAVNSTEEDVIGTEGEAVDEAFQEYERKREAEEAERRRKGGFVRNKRKHNFIRNGSETVLQFEGEKPNVLYRVDLFGDRGYTPNAAPLTLVSPGIVYNSNKKMEPARLLLPSPFVMIEAMLQE